jgi:hypothetical protein
MGLCASTYKVASFEQTELGTAAGRSDGFVRPQEGDHVSWETVLSGTRYRLERSKITQTLAALNDCTSRVPGS